MRRYLTFYHPSIACIMNRGHEIKWYIRQDNNFQVMLVR